MCQKTERPPAVVTRDGPETCVVDTTNVSIHINSPKNQANRREPFCVLQPAGSGDPACPVVELDCEKMKTTFGLQPNQSFLSSGG
jgi:hypothetical protein